MHHVRQIHRVVFLIGVLAFFHPVKPQGYVTNSIRNLFYNVVGNPLVHRQQQWPFDPDVGARRAPGYEQYNGKFGEIAIERLGLGVDGRELERLQQQRIRDEGHLGGLNAYLP